MEKQGIILQDKFFELGESPICNESQDVIGNVAYKLSIANKFALMPKLIISDHHGNEVGMIQRKFTFLKKKYLYIRNDGDTYEITGNITDRKFDVLRSGVPVIQVRTLSSFLSLRPHTFALEFLEPDLDKWEGIAVIQGVRMMVKDENSSTAAAPAQ
ncbi:hypothetical protein ABEP42_15550 [Priestia megaterium]|uniref:hypothetical protein n=1 Tax=Priestia megaterium TaxID=1404 RepID=UPI0031808A06